jgi:hypothetical protein
MEGLKLRGGGLNKQNKTIRAQDGRRASQKFSADKDGGEV